MWREEGSIDAIGNDNYILATKVSSEQGSGAGRDGREGHAGIGIDALFEASEKRVVEVAVEPAKEIRLDQRGTAVFARGFPKPVKESMNHDDIRVGAIDAGRQNEIKGKAPGSAVEPTVEPIDVEPEKELEEVRSRQGRKPMPNNAARLQRGTVGREMERKIFHTLGVKMDFAGVVAGETLEKLCEGAFRAVAPVNKRRDNGKPQVSAPRGVEPQVQLAGLRIARRRQGLAGGTRYLEAAIGKRSGRSPRKRPTQ